MIIQYIKQAWQMLRENALVSTISVAGTALSIAMIMVIVLLIQVKLAGYSPESERGRMLYISGTRAISKEKSANNNGRMSARVVKECFYSLKSPEAVTAINAESRAVSLPGKRLFEEYAIKYTDPGFWKVFDFHFQQGHPFTEADFQSGLPVAVVNEVVAAKLFGSENPVGKTIIVDYVPHTITGVVREVSRAASDAFAEVWIPYTSNSMLYQSSFCEGVAGSFVVVILAKEAGDFETIRNELKQQSARFNAGQQDYEVNFINNPLDRMDIAAGSTGFRKVEFREYLLDTGLLLLFLLLVPALNLTSVIQSSVQKRKGEVGLRKAFGATRKKLMMQVFVENLVITCLGGILGLLLAFVLLILCKTFLLDKDTLLNAGMLFKPSLFAAALLFALLLNLLSAAIPAFRISREQIVNALNDK